MRKSKQLKTKLTKTKLSTIYTDKLLRFLCLSLRNFSKYELLTDEDVLPEKDLSEKAIPIKIFDYSP